MMTVLVPPGKIIRPGIRWILNELKIYAVWAVVAGVGFTAIGSTLIRWNWIGPPSIMHSEDTPKPALPPDLPKITPDDLLKSSPGPAQVSGADTISEIKSKIARSRDYGDRISRLDQPLEWAEAKYSLGKYLIHLNDLSENYEIIEEAVNVLLDSLSVYNGRSDKQSRIKEAYVLTYLGFARQEQGKSQESLSDFQKALDIIEETQPDDWQFKGALLSEMAFSTDDLEEKAVLINRAIEVFKSHDDGKYLDQVEILTLYLNIIKQRKNNQRENR